MINFYAQSQDYLRSVGILITKDPIRGKRLIAKPVLLEFEEREDNDYIEDPTLRFSKEDAQRLMDELWSIGLRPTEAKYPNGEINRLEAHLSDMRALVFNKGGKDGE